MFSTQKGRVDQLRLGGGGQDDDQAFAQFEPPGVKGLKHRTEERATLEHLETVIARGLARHNEVALALLEIHDRKWCRPAYHSFKDYLLQGWQLSRAGGYQLLHFGRLKGGVHHGRQKQPH